MTNLVIIIDEGHDMNISLTPELEKHVNQKVATGMYQTASEVVREALRLFIEQEAVRLEGLRKEIRIGLDQLDRGEHSEFDERAVKDLTKEIKTQGRQRLSRIRKSRSQ